MKTSFIRLRNVAVLALAASFALTACGGAKTDDTAANTADSANAMNTPAADDAATAPAYDMTKIDPAAKVVEVKQGAEGNSMKEMKYTMKEIKVPAGSTVKLTLTNMATNKDAGMLHNMVIVKDGTMMDVAAKGITQKANSYVDASDANVFVHTKMLNAGEKDEITFPAMPKGKYQFVCTYPGHASMMNGVFIVE